MLKRILCACLALMMLLSWCALADTYVAAKKLKPSEEVYVLDRSGVLTDDTKGEIVYSNDLLFKACGAQIVVVTLDTTGRETIDDYATELFNTWGIGDAKKGNGFLLLLAIGDDNYYALCGDSLQPKFTAGALNDYFDRYLETDFAAKRYDAGVKKFFEAVFDRVAKTYNADVTVEQGIAAYEASGTVALPQSRFGGGSSYATWRAGDDDDETGFGMILGVFIVILLLVLLVRTSRRRRVARNVYVAPPPPPPPGVGQGGYRGVDSAPGMGGYRGPAPMPRRTPGSGQAIVRGVLHGMLRSAGSSFRSSGGSRSSRSSFGGGSRSSGSSFRSSGSSRSFGGGHSSGGGAGRGRH